MACSLNNGSVRDATQPQSWRSEIDWTGEAAVWFCGNMKLKSEFPIEGRAMELKAVGMIGLGIMGSAMSSNLIKAGFEVVGYDVLPQRRKDHTKAGGTAVRTCRDVAKGSDIIVTSLPSSEALLNTAAELADSARANQIVIE